MTQDLRSYYNVKDFHFYADKDTTVALMIMEASMDENSWKVFLECVLSTSVTVSFITNNTYRDRPVITRDVFTKALELYEKARLPG